MVTWLGTSWLRGTHWTLGTSQKYLPTQIHADYLQSRGSAAKGVEKMLVTRWGSSSSTRTSEEVMNPMALTHGWVRVLWWDSDPLSSCSPLQLPKKATGKACDFGVSFFFFFFSPRHWTELIGSMISFQKIILDFRHPDTSLNSAETPQKATKMLALPQSTAFFHA